MLSCDLAHSSKPFPQGQLSPSVKNAAVNFFFVVAQHAAPELCQVHTAIHIQYVAGDVASFIAR